MFTNVIDSSLVFSLVPKYNSLPFKVTYGFKLLLITQTDQQHTHITLLCSLGSLN